MQNFVKKPARKSYEAQYQIQLTIEAGDSEAATRQFIERKYSDIGSARREMAYLWQCAQDLGLNVIEDSIIKL